MFPSGISLGTLSNVTYALSNSTLSLSNAVYALSNSSLLKIGKSYFTCNVGIYNSNPQYTLDIIGDVNITGTFYKNGTEFKSSSGSGTTVSSAGSLLPNSNALYDLGSESLRWRNLYLSGNAISFGTGVTIDSTNWSYVLNYVVPPKQLSNPNPRVLFDGVAGDHSGFINAGSVYMFGRNDRGQLGLGDTTTRLVPTLVPNINNAVKIACGDGFTIVLLSDKSAVGFGTNTNGQLCQASLTSFSSAVVIPSLSNATNVTAGYSHVLYLLDTGIVVGAGSDAKGQLGDNATNTVTSTLVNMQIVYGTAKARAVSAGAYHSAVLLDNGSMYVCGDNTNGQLAADPAFVQFSSTPTQVSGGTGASNLVSIACGENHTLGVAYDGKVIGFGRNAEGQLGLGNTTARYTTPQVIITSATAGGNASGLSMSIDAGQNHSIVSMSNGDVFTWGQNDMGQLGVGQATTVATTPTQVIGISAFAVSAGRKHSLALRNTSVIYPNNQILAWGDNTWGQTGDGQLGAFTTIPSPTLAIRYLPNAITEAYNNKRGLMQSKGDALGYVDGDGTAYLCGPNGTGQLGNAFQVSQSNFGPCMIGNIQSAVCGNDFTVLLDTTGKVYTCGNNGFGQCGDGTTTTVNIPTQLSLSYSVVAIACGYYHTIMIDSAGKVYVFGYNPHGNLGDKSTTNRSTPTPLDLTYTVVAASAYGYTSAIIDSTGKLYTFGYNYYGQLGDGSNTDRNVPTPVSGTTKFVAVACGWIHLVALDASGRVYTCGNNGSGQLGTGDTVSRTTLTPLSLTYTVAAIASGENHVILIDTAGKVYTFGRNESGQLGDGGSTNRYTPYPLNLPYTVVAAACGYYNSMLMDSTGKIYTFGYNGFGQLGNGATTLARTPQLITDTIRTVTPKMLALGYGNHQVLRNRTKSPYSVPTTQVQIVGNNTYAQLGNGTTTIQLLPVTLSTTFPNNVTYTATSVTHSAAILSNGFIYLWGRNQSGQCGVTNTAINVTTPTQLVIINNALQCALGENYTLIRRSDDTVWGLGQFGTVNYGSTPSQINALTNIKLIAAGKSHAAAVDGGGILYLWGTSTDGQTATVNSTTPVAISTASFNGFPVDQVACGDKHTVIITKELYPRIFSVGTNLDGQLGVSTNFGTSTIITQFTRANLVNDITSNPIAVACGANHTAILLANGTVRVFGKVTFGTSTLSTWQAVQPFNYSFNILNISATASGIFLEYPDSKIKSFDTLFNITPIACGANHTVLLDSTGKVYTFGNNFYGQLGRGNTTSTNTPGTALSLSAVIVAVACGANHTVLLDSTGKVYTFGNNFYGELGIGNTTQSSSIQTITTATAISTYTTPSFINFTGQHRCYVDGIKWQDLLHTEGLIVCCNKNSYYMNGRKGGVVTINESLPIVTICKKEKDKSVFGVISFSTNYSASVLDRTLTVNDEAQLIEQGDKRVQVNAIGEGGIWIVNTAGEIEAGDYITSSYIPGYGMKQDEPYLCNYTVAKATMDCNFTKVMVQNYYNKTDDYGVNQYDQDGIALWEPETMQDDQGVITSRASQLYQLRYVDQDGTELTLEEYTAKKTDEQQVYIAAFIGCTYHCA